MTAMIYSEAGASASMAALAFVSVGLWTLRVALTARDRKLAGAAVAAGEALVFALVFSNLVANLGSWNRIMGYAIGVAVGTIAGLMLNERMSRGGVVVEAVVPGDGADLRVALCSGGWPATSVRATGLNGPATMVFVAVPTFRKDDVLHIVRSTAPEAYWSIRTAPAYHGLPAPEPEPTGRRGATAELRRGAERSGS